MENLLLPSAESVCHNFALLLDNYVALLSPKTTLWDVHSSRPHRKHEELRAQGSDTRFLAPGCHTDNSQMVLCLRIPCVQGEAQEYAFMTRILLVSDAGHLRATQEETGITPKSWGRRQWAGYAHMIPLQQLPKIL